MEPQTLKLKPRQLSCEFAADTANKESRTIDITWYTGATVDRYSWTEGSYRLTLSMEPAHVKMGRLNSGAPVLNTHSSYQLADVLGVVEKAWLDGNKGKATIRFSNRAEVDPIWQDVQDGIIRNASVGAKILKLKDVTGEGEKLKSYLATSWEPREISLVPVGADPDAGFSDLNTGAEEYFAEIELDERATGPKENVMEEKLNPTDPGAGAQAVINEAALKAAREEALLAERKRGADIRTFAARFKQLDATLAETHVAAGTTLDEFRAIALEALAERSESFPTQGHRSEITRDETQTFRDGMTEALLDRGGIETLKANSPGHNFRGVAAGGLLRMAEQCVRRMGKNPDRMSRSEIAELGLHSTSDLPYVLQSSSEKSLRAGYAAAPSQWQKIAAKRTASNFKTQREIMLGMTATLPRVAENGEYKGASISDGQETWQVYTYGNILGITRQMIINDDLGALTTLPQQMGRKAGIRQSNLVWAVVTANAALADNYALFSTNHSNYTSSGTAISVDSLGVGRKLMRVQTDAGADYIDIEPRYLVVPAAKEQLARQYTSNAFQPATNGNINPWAGTLEPFAEPRLDATSTTAWYLFADPAVAPVLIYAYLDGNEGIRQDSRIGFEVDGVELKISMDFGCGAIDYRGAYLNAGA